MANWFLALCIHIGKNGFRCRKVGRAGAGFLLMVDVAGMGIGLVEVVTHGSPKF
jgi:hypothetical protein